MKYIGKDFFVEKIKAEIIAKKFGTPAYCYSYSRLKENIKNSKIILNRLIHYFVLQLSLIQINTY